MHSSIIFLLLMLKSGLQFCPTEVTSNGVTVTWLESLPGYNISSSPPCYDYEIEVTRNCVNSVWIPAADELRPCLRDVQFYNLSSCAPGYYPISNNIKDFCYQLTEPSAWEYPCLEGGGATVITELKNEDLIPLLTTLEKKTSNRYFWLPAQRTRTFNPITWYVPGQYWGRAVTSNNLLRLRTSILANCLLLDIESKTMSTEPCTTKYPSLCFYVNNIYYPGKCPMKYHAVRYQQVTGVCFGIEHSHTKMVFDKFTENTCKQPMGDSKVNDLTRFIFKNIAANDNLPNDTWCWFSKAVLFNYSFTNWYSNIVDINQTTENPTGLEIHVAINSYGTISLKRSSSMLSCMACETEVLVVKTEFKFEYSDNENIMVLTVYYPSGLWKYDIDDRGIQCFSDAKGFVKVIESEDFFQISEGIIKNKSLNMDIITYGVNLVTNRSAQYWCEGHTDNFSLISTNKIVVTPPGNDVYVFALVIIIPYSDDDLKSINTTLDIIIFNLCSNIEHIFKANKVLLMEVLEYSIDYVMVLLHMHVSLESFHEGGNANVSLLYNTLKHIAKTGLPFYNYTFVNISSSMYCLPTTSEDKSMSLDWDTTSIGQVVAPKQFCLQANGLPVYRRCDGSYLYGGFWNNVMGTCNQKYLPSNTTTFLYGFVQGLVPDNFTSRFLTKGLELALNNTDIIIPADIFYLSKSLQHVLYLTQDNETDVDLGSIANIAWAMNRIMVVKNNYLRTAQILNSTNAILDAISKIIKMIAIEDKKTFISLYYNNKQCKPLLQQAIEKQFIIQISYPKLNNISGIALCKTSDSKTFTDMEIILLYRNTSIEDVLSIDNLEIATWVPDSVLDTLKIYNNQSEDEVINEEDIHIIINIFYNDSIFQQLNSNNYKVNSRVVEIFLPGFISNLQYPIPLIFKDINNSSNEKLCGYWDFHSNENSDVPGFWSNRGCYLRYSLHSLTLCECYHLTHFGQLLHLGSSDFDKKHVLSLNIISLTGSFLSLIGIVGIWITASVFHKWRKKAGTKVLLHLSGAIALPVLYMVVLNLGNPFLNDFDDKYNNMRIACIVTGSILHYSVLVSFMWMLITAVLQYLRYVRVLGVHRPSRFMIKLTLIGWGIPTIPVIIILLINSDTYIPDNVLNSNATSPICYPSGFYLLMGVVLPVCVILFINVILYVLVLRAISQGPDGKMRLTDIDLIGAQFRLSIFLFFLLGFTWIFGLLSFTNQYLWSYLFCLTSTLQGFILFVYFIIFDPDTRNLWATLMKPPTGFNKSRESITSVSS